MDKKKFETPYLEWHLSEILAVVVLNDFRIRKLLKYPASFYKEHQQIKINGRPAPTYFQFLYNKYQKNKSSFNDFLALAYQEIKKEKNNFKI